jgi:hypothetical protein
MVGLADNRPILIVDVLDFQYHRRCICICGFSGTNIEVQNRLRMTERKFVTCGSC